MNGFEHCSPSAWLVDGIFTHTTQPTRPSGARAGVRRKGSWSGPTSMSAMACVAAQVLTIIMPDTGISHATTLPDSAEVVSQTMKVDRHSEQGGSSIFQLRDLPGAIISGQRSKSGT